MSEGIVSGLSRTIPADTSNSSTSTGGNLLDPRHHPDRCGHQSGHSGGVLVDDQGRLIGVTAAMESSSNSSSGVGFVIPSAIVEKVVPALITNGKYDHPWLGPLRHDADTGLGASDESPSVAKGVLVITVVDNGPSATAGLKPSDQTATVSGQQVPVGGDVITGINGQQ